VEESTAVSRTSRRTAALGAALVLGVGGLLTGCAAGQNATTRMAYAPADGVEATVGPMKVVNVLVVASPDGNQGVLSMSIANTGSQPDELVGLLTSAGSVSYDGPTALPPGGVLDFASSPQKATIDNLQVKAGQTITVTVRFKNAGEASLQTVVYPATGAYATLTPAASPTPSPSPTAVQTSPPAVSGTPVATVPVTPTNSATAPNVTTVTPTS
jgi:copper(I)-binding protein